MTRQYRYSLTVHANDTRDYVYNTNMIQWFSNWYTTILYTTIVIPQYNMYNAPYFPHLYMHIFTPLEIFSNRWQILGFNDSYRVYEGVDFEYYVFEGP